MDLEHFEKKTSDFVNQGIVEKLKWKLSKVELQDKIYALIKNDEVHGYMEQACKKFYEEVILEYLTTQNGVTWKQRKYDHDGKPEGDWKTLTLPKKKKNEGKIPVFNEIDTNTVYYSFNNNFPAFDMVYKEGKKLVCIQVTRHRKNGKREISRNAFDKFCKTMGNVGINDLELVLVPIPNKADESKLVVQGER